MDIRLKLSDDPSKQEEIDVYNKFVDSLPVNSYLNLILKNTKYYVEREIKDDFGLPLVDSRQVDSLRETNEQLYKANKALEKKVYFLYWKMKKALRRFRHYYKNQLLAKHTAETSRDGWKEDYFQELDKNKKLNQKLEFVDNNLFN